MKIIRVLHRNEVVATYVSNLSLTPRLNRRHQKLARGSKPNSTCYSPEFQQMAPTHFP